MRGVLEVKPPKAEEKIKKTLYPLAHTSATALFFILFPIHWHAISQSFTPITSDTYSLSEIQIIISTFVSLIHEDMNLSKFDIRGRSDVGAGGVVGLGILYCLSFFGFSNKK